MEKNSNSSQIKIALIGYGKMGKAIEEIALQHGHRILLKIDHDNLADFTKENLQQADVAIEFTSPHSAYDNIKRCIEWHVPIVSGSTGWAEKLEELKTLNKDFDEQLEPAILLLDAVIQKWTLNGAELVLHLLQNKKEEEIAGTRHRRFPTAACALQESLRCGSGACCSG